LRIVFFGTPELALPSLQALAERHEVAALVCQPDKPGARTKKLIPPPTKVWALEHGIEINQPLKLRTPEFKDWLKGKAPDVCALVAYGRIIRQSVLDIPPHGFINVHPSLLPRHRGPSPIQTAILKGDKETGVTIMALDAGTDTGDILSQERVAIEPFDTTKSLSAKLAPLGARMLVEALDVIASGSAVFRPQDDSLATHTKKYEKADGQIRWHMGAGEIHNMVRAAVPWPVAHCAFRGDILRIHETQPLDESSEGEPGTVMRIDTDALIVSTGDHALAVRTLQLPGKKPLGADAFLRGTPVEPGERFEEL
jgi:methionyl-tRNA formyltransferase